MARTRGGKMATTREGKMATTRGGKMATTRGGRGRGRGRPRKTEPDHIVYVGASQGGRRIRNDRIGTQSKVSASVRSEEEQRDGTQSQRSANNPPSPICLTEMAKMCTDGSVNEEAESSQSLVTVGGYRVKRDVAPLLGRIFAKYGDIARDSDFQSLRIRTCFLEIVCSIVQKMQISSIKTLSVAEINRMFGDVQDLERNKLNVGWLKSKIEQILEVKKMVRNYPSMKEKKANMEAKKQQLKSFEAYLAALQQDLAAVQNEIPLINQELQEMTNEYEEGTKKYAEMQHEIREAFQKDLAEGLL